MCGASLEIACCSADAIVELAADPQLRSDTMPHPSISFTVEATEAGVHSARRRVSSAVRGWMRHLDEDLYFDLELVTSELLTNGLRHTCGRMTAQVTLAHGLAVVEVFDGSRDLPRPRSTQNDDECGRGLMLIENLCLLQGAETTDSGKRCWAILSVDIAPARAAEVQPREEECNDSTTDDDRWSLSPIGKGLLSRLFPTP
ncbi:ATP-binding protein [Streptomyces parvus]|uniref:ATP-binding protein n=1 Tax=Streptomyces parvus TaxID=66428 RepID=UPI0027E56868|nr:ATP-binding protein [Streptomyces parvus]